MKTTQSQAAKRLFKKLSALRVTLPNEERAILDNLIGVDEVSAHQMTAKALDQAVSPSGGKALGKSTEVAAHKQTGKAMGKAMGKSEGKAMGKSAEVSTHKTAGKAMGKAGRKSTDKVVRSFDLRVTFDENSEEYKIQE
jgi:hypothetical protein